MSGVGPHRDAETITSARTMSEECPVTHDDVDALLENGFNIVNRYKVAFFGSFFLRDSISTGGDYLKVLRTLQKDVEAAEATFREEMRRAKEEAS